LIPFLTQLPLSWAHGLEARATWHGHRAHRAYEM